jgi:hypothetical protein
MTKKVRFISACLLISIILAGCYGNFALTRKLYEWNGQVGDKFMNNIVFWVFNIIPVYGAVNFADAVVFNLIEFWTDENPIAISEGVEKIQYTTIEGIDYQVKMMRNYLELTPINSNNDKIAIEYNEVMGTWNLTINGENHQIAKMGNNKVDLIYPDGSILQKDMVLH